MINSGPQHLTLRISLKYGWKVGRAVGVEELLPLTVAATVRQCLYACLRGPRSSYSPSFNRQVLSWIWRPRQSLMNWTACGKPCISSSGHSVAFLGLNWWPKRMNKRLTNSKRTYPSSEPSVTVESKIVTGSRSTEIVFILKIAAH